MWLAYQERGTVALNAALPIAYSNMASLFSLCIAPPLSLSSYFLPSWPTIAAGGGSATLRRGQAEFIIDIISASSDSSLVVKIASKIDAPSRVARYCRTIEFLPWAKRRRCSFIIVHPSGYIKISLGEKFRGKIAARLRAPWKTTIKGWQNILLFLPTNGAPGTAASMLIYCEFRAQRCACVCCRGIFI